MKTNKTLILVVALAAFTLMSLSAFAGPRGRKGARLGQTNAQCETLTDEEKAARHEERRAEISSILEDAGVPLTTEQIEELDAIEIGSQFSEQRSSIFTDEQHDALRAKRQQGNRGRQGRGRNNAAE